MNTFADDIRPLFRDKDVAEMSKFFDLRSYDDVCAHAEAILDRLELGNMPCDGMWPEAQVDLFREWIEQGMQP